MSVPTVSIHLQKLRRRKWQGAPITIALPATILLLLLVLCFLVPLTGWLADPMQGTLSEARKPPGSPGHALGSDALGMDILARVLVGGQASFIVGIGATVLGLIVGGLFGAAAGFFHGAFDAITMRVLDVFLSIPALVLALTVAAFLGPSRFNEILAVTFFLAPASARMARAATLNVRHEDYIAAARLNGSSDLFILFRHVVPNIASPMLTFAILQVGVAIIVQASLSYLGLGAPPPAPSWGSMMALGQQYLATAPWIVLIPGAFLLTTVICLNLLGEAVRERWDAR
ncbi:ABC transporter permease [Arthrobacter sp. CAU 1506]|uniref:ABC transporter permease n=1 Tax=Arthrobacter sp. CAU 1506 TaxID=2560052 RepID=UPI00145EFE1D|nr:ABC transporter permease [Arthrobacter sp. CAU 1506]